MANRTKSVIDESFVDNHDRRFGADGAYIPAFVRRNGKLVPALFTSGQISVAVQRAARNAEDAPAPTLWQRLFG